jgi:hypothetical protein
MTARHHRHELGIALGTLAATSAVAFIAPLRKA